MISSQCWLRCKRIWQVTRNLLVWTLPILSLLLTMAEDFHIFASLNPTALYLEEFFKSLMFMQAFWLNLPVIMLPHSVSGWSFSPEILFSASANLILPCETTVPCMASILPILRGMQEAFAKRMHSVRITRQSGHGTTMYNYHFSKVCTTA